MIVDAARSAFLSGMHVGLLTAAVVALGGAVIALATIPGRAHATRRRHHPAKRTGAPLPGH